jgi:hypothetical protein
MREYESHRTENRNKVAGHARSRHNQGWENEKSAAESTRSIKLKEESEIMRRSRMKSITAKLAIF